MIAQHTSVRLTYEDYLLIPEDGKRHELVDGAEYMSPAPTTRHQRIVRRLLTAISDFVEDNGLGEAFVSPVDVILSDADVVQPDVLFVSEARAEIVQKHGIVGAPELVVEVVSEGHRRHDEVRKRGLYEAFGVQEYWIVDPELDLVKVYRRAAAGFGPKVEWTAEAADVLASPLLPGFELPLARLFA